MVITLRESQCQEFANKCEILPLLCNFGRSNCSKGQTIPKKLYCYLDQTQTANSELANIGSCWITVVPSLAPFLSCL